MQLGQNPAGLMCKLKGRKKAHDYPTRTAPLFCSEVTPDLATDADATCVEISCHI